MELEMEMLQDLSREEKVEYFALGGGSFGLVLGVLIYIFGSRPIGGALFLASLIGGFLPYGIYVYFQNKKYSQMEKQFPPFLRNLSESIKSGMSLPQAFQNTTKTDFGRLNEELEKAANQLSWDVPFPEVMERMKDRIEGSRLIRNSITIIMQSYESGGDIAETMDSISRSATDIKEAAAERQATLKQQVYIIYAIYFLFAGIVIALYRILQPLLDIGGGGFIGSSPNFCTLSAVQPVCGLCPLVGLGDPTAKLCYYKALFLIMLIVQGVFSGIVAGEIGSGEASAGVKHALLMVPAGIIIYLAALSLL